LILIGINVQLAHWGNIKATLVLSRQGKYEQAEEMHRQVPRFDQLPSWSRDCLILAFVWPNVAGDTKRKKYERNTRLVIVYTIAHQ
jgi:hypothetical protein